MATFSTTKTMKAALLHQCGNIDDIKIELAPIALPKSHEVQIAIKSAGLNPVDYKIAEGMLKGRLHHEFPIILGWDAAGVISAVGDRVKNLKVGDEVFAYCRKETIHEGSCADYICLNEDVVALKPNLSFSQAASIPLACLTAWQSLYDVAKVQSHETVLIHAGAGGVGFFAIQLAKLKGAKVITTASAKNHAYVSLTQADWIIDYTKDSFVDEILKKYPNGIDVVFDTMGGETLKKSCDVLKTGGRLVSIVTPVDPSITSKKIQADYVFVRPDGEELKQIAALFNQKKLLPPTIKEIAFTEIPKALHHLKSRSGQGKFIVIVN